VKSPHYTPAGSNGPSRSRPRVAIVGAGIVGLAHAWCAARRGWEVLLFERNRRACGASIRNFGMVWPIGQPDGPLHQLALKSRALWREITQETGAWAHECGSLHLAYRDDEWNVISEFAGLASASSASASSYECELISPEDVCKRSPAARADGLLGALWSPTEICVDPREIIARTPGWLRSKFGVQLHFDVSIDRVASGSVTASTGDRYPVDRVIIAAGAEFNLLYPELFAIAGFRRCKLQMMRTAPQKSGWSLGPMLAGGLTLRHYDAFRTCKTLAALERRVAQETPELDRFGIHVMAAQNGLGELILGDSHEYDDDITPFDKAEVDDLILRELRRIMDVPDWTIAERWHGIYVKAPGTIQFRAEPEPEVHAAIASGGCGMTMSFGLADEQWSSWEAEADGQIDAQVQAPASTRFADR
jgi:D-hydroxyproline dehydrogenase subunit beta